MASKNIITLTAQNFEQEVLKSDIPVMVDFWAAWCGPCRMIGPVIEKLADEYEGKVKIGKVNVDEEGPLAQQYKVMSIPMVGLFKDGKMAEQIVGARPAGFYKKALDKALV